jgi:SAM-dependent methyltransferase
MAVLQPWADVAEPIHRRVAQLVDAEPGQEVLWVGCGTGRSVLWWAKRFETHVQGIDSDPMAVEAAEAQARAAGLSRLASFQAAEPFDLPHEAQVFDVSIADFLNLELGGVPGDRVIAELARVVRPMGTVAALVPSWLSTPEDDDVAAVAALGIEPVVLVEWKKHFRSANVVELAVEDAALDGGWIAHGLLGLVVRGWHAGRWNGVRTSLGPEVGQLRALVQRRTLGLSIVKGTRWQPE